MVYILYRGANFDTPKTIHKLSTCYILFIRMVKLIIPFSKGVIFDTLGVLFLTPYNPYKGVIFDTL